MMARKNVFPPVELLRQEQAEMAEHFPRWSLTVLDDIMGSPLHCPRCRVMVRLSERGIVCPECGCEIQIPQSAALAWVGHMPVPVNDLTQARARIARHPHPSYPLVQVGDAEFLLVPLVAAYSRNWPHEPPTVRYDHHLATMLELPSWYGSTYHILNNDMLCIYYPGHWTAQTMRNVLQQRVVNHLASLLKCANGVPPQQAFLGRIHNQPWESQG